jgi:hypothetical protein
MHACLLACLLLAFEQEPTAGSYKEKDFAF